MNDEKAIVAALEKIIQNNGLSYSNSVMKVAVDAYALGLKTAQEIYNPTEIPNDLR